MLSYLCFMLQASKRTLPGPESNPKVGWSRLRIVTFAIPPMLTKHRTLAS